jgi:hypothetical protein
MQPPQVIKRNDKNKNVDKEGPFWLGFEDIEEPEKL